MTRTTITTPIPERTTQRLTARIRDENGLGFKPDTLTLLLYDQASGSVINNRNRVNIRDANGGTVSTDGALVLQLDPADSPILTDTLKKETHIALLEWTWGSGPKSGKHEIEFAVTNLAKVP